MWALIWRPAECDAALQSRLWKNITGGMPRASIKALSR